LEQEKILNMPEPTGMTIGIIPDVRGLGGPASFHQKFVAGLAKRGVQVSYDLSCPDLRAVLVIAGSRHLGWLRNVKKKGIPIIQRLDGMNWVHKRKYTGVKHFLRSEVNNWILQTIRRDLAARVIYQSRFSQSWWEGQYGPVAKPTTVIYNGIDLDLYRPANEPIPTGGPIRLMAVEGHLKNGIETGLVNAVTALRGWPDYRGQPVRLAVAGDVPAEVRSRIDPLLPGRIDWLGILKREVIPDQLHQSHLFFSVELNPACPNAVIEALACGVPVMAFNSGSIRELVDDASGAILPYDTDVWKMQLADGSPLPTAGTQLLDHLDDYRRGARDRALRLFQLDEMVQAYLKFLLGD
jgi:glycosyltransferase involved in cell wall biosynthesis